ncbi:hypothetical protein [Nocardioides rubriscoriae]|uniref:hypothetical protein n=1 Tax=Nocardioides rubriscoriae TaxID=642762 RepID=UPI0011E0059E|nr:hypothetical protein [Nocardioides rubriscoriae]
MNDDVASGRPLTSVSGLEGWPLVAEIVRGQSGSGSDLDVTQAGLLDVVATCGVSPATPGAPTTTSIADSIVDLLQSYADEPLAMRIGSWHVNLPVTTFQTLFASGLLVGGVELLGIESTAAVVLAAVVPFVVDIEHVRVSPSQRIVLAKLTADLTTPAAVRDLWDKLPPDLQHELTFLEFVDLLDALERAGALTRGRDDRYSLPSEHGWLSLRLGD